MDQRFVVVAVVIFAGLILVATFVHLDTQPKGHYVFLARQVRRYELCEDRSIAVRLEKDGGLYINYERKATVEELTSELRDIYKNKCEKLVLLVADDELSYQDVVTRIDQLRSQVPHLNVVLVGKNQGQYCGGPTWREGIPLDLPPCQ